MSTGTKSAYIKPKGQLRRVPPKSWLKGRRYRDAKPLPALQPQDRYLSERRQAVLLALYAEVCNGWRSLTDVRFKLLGLVPIISMTVAITLLSRGELAKGMQPIEKTGIALFGLFITLAVRLYDLRNTQLYNDLVGRGRQIEAELGIHTGNFRGRPESTNKLVKHDTAIWAIYILSIIGWLLIVAAPWLPAR